MAVDLTGFDAEKAASEGGSFDVLPQGDYIAQIVDSTQKEKDGGMTITLKLEILEGQYKGRFVWDTLGMRHSSEKWVAACRRRLGQAMMVFGITKPRDTAEIHFKPLTVSLTVREDDSGQVRNNVKGYKPRQSAAPTFGAPAAATGAGKPNPFG